MTGILKYKIKEYMLNLLLAKSKNIFIKNKFNNAELIIWDLDETLFYSNKILKLTRTAYFILYIRDSISCIAEFDELIDNFIKKEKTMRWFEIVSAKLNISFSDAMILAENIIKKENHISLNSNLVSFFSKSNKNHLILTNSSTKGAKKILKSLGFENETCFLDVIGLDQIKQPKPQTEILEKIASKYSVSKSKCLVIGNSILDDLQPAELLKMKTLHISNSPDIFSFNSVESINKLLDLIHD